MIALLFDLAQIYQQKAHDSLDKTDLAHAKRYREAAETIKRLEQENAELKSALLAESARIDVIDATFHECIEKCGRRWYWREGYGMPHHRAESLRDAADRAIACGKTEEPERPAAG